MLTDSTYDSNGVVTSNHRVESFTVYGSAGNDTIDASAWTGGKLVAYGGDGNDVIKGGSGDDQLRGDGGDDVIEGNGGNDDLYGDGWYKGASTGNDILRGGDGNDNLYGDDAYYGGTGNDRLEGGDDNDNLSGFNGNNEFVDDSFTQISAGTGYDRVILPSLGATIDLVSNPTSYMQGIEEIDLTGSGNNTLNLNQSRVLSLSDTTDTLIVSANVGDSVLRDSGWTTTGTETINGSVYKVQINGAATLKVQQATDVNLVLLPLQVVQTLTYSLDNSPTPCLQTATLIA